MIQHVMQKIFVDPISLEIVTVDVHPDDLYKERSRTSLPVKLHDLLVDVELDIKTGARALAAEYNKKGTLKPTHTVGRCLWCGKELPQRDGRSGRKKMYCDRKCWYKHDSMKRSNATARDEK